MNSDDIVCFGGLPSPNKIRRLLVIQQRHALTCAERLTVTQKRLCFAALRECNDTITARQVLMPVGVSIGEFSAAQILQCNNNNNSNSSSSSSH